MDPKRPRTPDQLALEAEANKQPAQRSVDEGTPAPLTEAATDKQVADADPTSGTLDPADLFGSFDVGAQAVPDVVFDARVVGRSTEAAADNAASGDTLASDAAFTPPSIEEIVASFRAPPIDDVPAVTAARDMGATWQDLPVEFDSLNDNVTADRREATHDRAPEGNSQSAPATVDVGAFMATEPIEPPSGATEALYTLDRTPRANPSDYIAIGTFLGPSHDPTVIQRGPLRTDDDSWQHSIKLLSGTSSDSNIPERPSDPELSPRATKLQSPTPDGGPPLARPIFLISVPDEQTRRILDEALAGAGGRDAKTAAEVAKQQVDDAFWLRACEERALYRGR
jgi:hypothetical protein